MKKILILIILVFWFGIFIKEVKTEQADQVCCQYWCSEESFVFMWVSKDTCERMGKIGSCTTTIVTGDEAKEKCGTPPDGDGGEGTLKSKPGKVTVNWIEKLVSVCPPGIFGSQPCEYPDLIFVIQKIWNFILDIAPLVLVILLILGGFMYLLSPFDIRRIGVGHRYIQWAIYGYIILLLISLIFTFISAVFGGPKI